MKQKGEFSPDDLVYYLGTVSAELEVIIPLCTMGRFEFAKDALELLKNSIEHRVSEIKGAQQ